MLPLGLAGSLQEMRTDVSSSELIWRLVTSLGTIQIKFRRYS